MEYITTYVFTILKLSNEPLKDSCMKEMNKSRMMKITLIYIVPIIMLHDGNYDFFSIIAIFTMEKI